jgi:hypothetical protein
MNKERAHAFVQDWLDAWNTRDMPRILAHYDDEFEMHSPLIGQMGAKSGGCLRGKPAVAAYWAQALSLHPQVRFELESVLVGVNSLVIQYRLPNARKVAEVMAFNEVGRVVRSHAHYEA